MDIAEGLVPVCNVLQNLSAKNQVNRSNRLQLRRKRLVQECKKVDVSGTILNRIDTEVRVARGLKVASEGLTAATQVYHPHCRAGHGR
jgi:hypothetical protein